jgi:hypothetical protein
VPLAQKLQLNHDTFCMRFALPPISMPQSQPYTHHSTLLAPPHSLQVLLQDPKERYALQLAQKQQLKPDTSLVTLNPFSCLQVLLQDPKECCALPLH